ncbi:AMP-binding protein [Microbacterium sp. SORGH_AS_0888]|uniref:AMP-binding protein n=1 Tax=Microbacterium sp. SORGH_AS_0888 TaxID=3041791 RepID=UPI002784F883|nr:AMP-binding protein [Microbacterium sp. SORGH_AS_0888]MDQ1130655.1 O-succinylbenzoic acid--CoA ligase [Microbacterium sp. SORGH_AS_0888]
MKAQPPEGPEARAVLRALRRALEGPGPAVLLGGDGSAAEVPAGTAAVVTTSGSTGYPKSVVLSRSALISSADATADRLGAGSWLLALPPTYVAGLQVLVRSLMAGREPAVLEGRFSARAFAAAARGMASSVGGERVPAFTSLVPAQLARLVAAADDTDVASSLRAFDAILVGGQALPAPLEEQATALGARIVRTYGSSETSGGCVYDGVPLRGVDVRIEDGEVQVSGPTLADGYLGEPERTAAAFVRDAGGVRWYRTGDAGEHEDGRVRVTGRLDNVIISGGVNVSLDRVEQVVRGLPGLAGAVVVGVEDPRWGEAPAVVVTEDTAAELADIRVAVRAALGAPARPARLVRVPALPVLASGKPDRVALRRLLG